MVCSRLISVALAAVVFFIFSAASYAADGLQIKEIYKNLRTFSSTCGNSVRLKENESDKLVIVVGEYHRFTDIQKEVECLMKELAKSYPIEFVGKEGVYYRGGIFYKSQRPKLNLGIPLIGLEGEFSEKNRARIREIDNRHWELSKKKMEIGLSAMEAVEYKHVSSLSYEIILRKRSWEWVDNLNDFMAKNGKSIGLINTGFGHFPTLEERFDHYKISYMLILPASVDKYVECEAYWQKVRVAGKSAKEICDDPKIPARWD